MEVGEYEARKTRSGGDIDPIQSMVSFNCQLNTTLESFEKRDQLKECPDQTGLQARL